MGAGQRSNRILVPEARKAMDQFKFEVASEVGVQSYNGYLGHLPSRVNGSVGGNMVRKMIAAYEQSLAGK